MNSKLIERYVGTGVRFEVEDFTYLLGTVPKISKR
jgi:hypothetical protein